MHPRYKTWIPATLALVLLAATALPALAAPRTGSDGTAGAPAGAWELAVDAWSSLTSVIADLAGLGDGEPTDLGSPVDGTVTSGTPDTGGTGGSNGEGGTGALDPNG